MNNSILSYIINFVALVLLQVLILNNIQLGGFINPYLYILFILLLPVDMPGWIILLLGFIMGITVDMFCSTPGIHAFATTLISYLRIKWLEMLSPRGDYEQGVIPIVDVFGWVWFFKFTIPLVVIHHITLFGFEAFSLRFFWLILGKTILSAIFTMFLIIVSQSFYNRVNIG